MKNILETDPITVTPVLYLSNGAKYALPALTLPPAGTDVIDVNAALQSLGIAPYATLTGYLELQYTWPWTPLCAVIKNVDTAHSLIFGSLIQASIPASGQNKNINQTVEGLWWKQEPNVTGFMTISNITSQPVTTIVQVSDNQGAAIGTHTLTISSHGTKTLNLQELQSTSGTEGGIRVSYTGLGGALMVYGGLEDQSVGYSAALNFMSTSRTRPLPAGAKPQARITTAELGLMTGAADPMMRLPAGTTFTPYTVLRNITSQPLSVVPTIWYMQGGTAASAPLPQLTLLPFETRSVDIAVALASAGLKNFNGSFNLALDTGGASGLLVSSGSVDQKNTYVFEVTSKPIVESAGKSMPYWSTANGDDTMVTIWNPAYEAQDFIFKLFFAGGYYGFPVQLGPKATQSFNISEIIASQVPDAEGNIIPANIQQGSMKIIGSQADNQEILVGIDTGVYNAVKATCGPPTYCYTCDGYVSQTMQANPFGVAVNGSNQLNWTFTWDTGQQYNYNSQGTWGSSATNVATVSTGMVRGVSGGSVTAWANDSNFVPAYAQIPCGQYDPCPVGGLTGGSSSGSVCQVTSVDPDIAMVGSNSLKITLSGSGFGTSPSLSLPAGFTKTAQTATNTSIAVTVNIASSATIGDNDIGVSVNGSQCDTGTFTADGPYYLVVNSDTFFPNNDGFGDGMRRITYQIQNFGGSNVTSSIPVGETGFSDTGWNCTNRSAPTIIATQCGQGRTSSSDGTLTDDWAIESNVTLTPTGCGFSSSSTTWNWCDGSTFTHELTVINGFVHTNAVQEFGVTNPPNHISAGTREPH